MKTINNGSRMALGLSVAALIGTMTVTSAQTSAKKKNIVQRHPFASSVVAGAAAHHYAKIRRHGFIHKHPMITGLAAATVTHHYAKKK